MTTPSDPGTVGRQPGVHLDEDTCLDLLHGLLAPEQRDHAVAHVRNCAACEKLLQTRGAQRERFRARETLAASAATVEARADSEVESPIERPPGPRPDGVWARLRRFVRFTGAIPAVAAVVVAAIFIIVRGRSGPASDLLAPRWLPPASSMMEPRSDAPREDHELAEGLRAYARHDLAAAIAHLDAARSSDWQIDRMRTVYLASALQANGESRRAAATLDTLRMDDLPDPWGGEARWTYWLALRGSSQRARADSVLQELAREPGAIGERARAARH